MTNSNIHYQSLLVSTSAAVAASALVTALTIRKTFTSPTPPTSSPSNTKQFQWRVYWDLENVPVPRDTDPSEFVHSLLNTLSNVHPCNVSLDSPKPIAQIIATADVSRVPKYIRSRLHATGVSILHVDASKRKDTADKALLVDLCISAADLSPPAGIALLSGDIDFSYALARLRARGFFTAVIAPVQRKGLANALRSVPHALVPVEDLVLANEHTNNLYSQKSSKCIYARDLNHDQENNSEEISIQFSPARKTSKPVKKKRRKLESRKDSSSSRVVSGSHPISPVTKRRHSHVELRNHSGNRLHLKLSPNNQHQTEERKPNYSRNTIRINSVKEKDGILYIESPNTSTSIDMKTSVHSSDCKREKSENVTVTTKQKSVHLNNQEIFKASSASQAESTIQTQEKGHEDPSREDVSAPKAEDRVINHHRSDNYLAIERISAVLIIFILCPLFFVILQGGILWSDRM